MQINGDDIEVLFVDYGNKQRSPISLAKVIDEEFAALPAQGYHCSLKGVADKNEWNAEDVKRFEQVAMERRLIATFSPHREDDKFPVCLCAKNADGSSITINDLFRAPPVTKIPIPSEDYEHLPVEATASNVNIAWFCDVERFFLSPVDFSPYQVNAFFYVECYGFYYLGLETGKVGQTGEVLFGFIARRAGRGRTERGTCLCCQVQ